MKKIFLIKSWAKFITSIYILFYMGIVTAEPTTQNTIGRISYNKNNATTYVSNANSTSWGVVGCPSARYVIFDTLLDGGKGMLSFVLTAKAAGKLVSFDGDCNLASNTVFNANSFTIHD